MSFRLKALAGVVVALAVTRSGHAALLGLTFYPPPDITATYIDVTYNALSDQFVADGYAQVWDAPPANTTINTTVLNYHLDATIDGSGNLTPGGSFSVTGTTTVGPNTYGSSGPLLTGTVALWGYGDTPANYDLSEFVIVLTGGELAIPAYYGDPGTSIGIIMDAEYGGAFTGSFANSFNNNLGSPGFGNGRSDNKPIPEPMTITLLAAGAVGLLRRRSR